MSVGTTSDFQLTRNQIIETALKKCRALSEGETMTAEQIQDGVWGLNMIIRETDIADLHLWAIPEAPSTLTLQSNIFTYTSAEGLPTDILELVDVVYRDAQASDTPLKIIRPQDYDSILTKRSNGDPKYVTLSRENDLSTRTMRITPMLDSVNSQDEVIGSDAVNYKCIRSHTATTDNKPITGADWRLFWEAGGSSGSAWAADTAYTAPQLVIIRYKQPLKDFDAIGNSADLPQGMDRWLIYRLAYDMSDDYGVPLDERRHFKNKAAEAFSIVFPYFKPNVNNHHNVGKRRRYL